MDMGNHKQLIKKTKIGRMGGGGDLLIRHIIHRFDTFQMFYIMTHTYLGTLTLIVM